MIHVNKNASIPIKSYNIMVTDIMLLNNKLRQMVLEAPIKTINLATYNSLRMYINVFFKFFLINTYLF